MWCYIKFIRLHSEASLGPFAVPYFVQLKWFICSYHNLFGLMSQEQMTIIGIPCFWKVCLRPLHLYKRHVFLYGFLFSLTKKSEEDFWFHLKRQKAETVFRACFYSERPRVPQTGRPAPPSSFPGSNTPRLSVKSPPPWTLSGSTCALLVHVHFMHLLAECVLGSLLLCFMLFWLMKGFLGVLCFRAVGKPGLGTGGAAICPLHPPHPPQSGHHVIFRHFVNYPAIHLYVHFPRVHNHDFT